MASALGHVSYVINGSSYSWERGGWHIEKIEDYLKKNAWREGIGYVLDDPSDPFRAEELAQQVKAFKGDGNSIVPGFGPYGLVQDNCGEAFGRAVNRMNLPHDGATAPVQHQAYIMHALKPYIKEINFHNRSK